VTVSPNFNDRTHETPVDMLIIHYTGMKTCEEAKARLCDSDAKVSAHYLIEQDGTVHRLVDEDKRAWHAGISWWRGAVDINKRSIGIELVNPGHEFGYQTFPKEQMTALIQLAKAILMRHNIPARNIVGHSDIAPLRKQDPGELFDWHKLAAAGVGLWVDASRPVKLDDDQARIMFSAFGYSVTDLTATTVAFQRHFRPSCIDGVMDPQTGGLLKSLIEHL